MHKELGWFPGGPGRVALKLANFSEELNEEHQKLVLTVGSDKDDLGGGMDQWLNENYADSKLKIVHGGHIAALSYMDEI